MKKMSLGDEGVCDVESCGIVIIERYVNDEWIEGKLENVLFVPLLTKNLLSVGACTNKIFAALFKKNSVELYLNKKLIASGILQKNNLFRMLFRVVKVKANLHAASRLKL
ncbi:copia protein [Lasius niger]|uniref:Copia protein n=1 Tax=Lasius niger TaxID=67767 RepID=A0A0J7K842_LASNI|nr:copia protein [Lasius niger]